MKTFYRPKWQFSPKVHWMNDPNGLVYHEGVYHLFFQYRPDADPSAPMHWGHASSTDLFHWQDHPIALYPDELGCIYSGSAVVDADNTSSLAKDGRAPLVCLFTHNGPNPYGQQQSVAYSIDGIHFEKYEGNPVIPNPGCRDFRDPKVFRYDEENCWIMLVAAGDHVKFYRSEDLLHWNETGTFGKSENLTPGTWECPDLIPMTVDGERIWVMLISMGLTREEGRSRTQYFVGQFDGKTFRVNDDHTETLWLDHGPDCYAGVTFHGAPNGRHILISWMSNWLYAPVAPTEPYQGHMSVPMELSLRKTQNGYRIYAVPVPEIESLRVASQALIEGAIPGDALDMELEVSGFGSILLENDAGEYVEFGLDADNHVFIDRTHAGGNEIDLDFCKRFSGPRRTSGSARIRAIWDHCALTVFYDDGAGKISTVLFSQQPFTHLKKNGCMEGTVYTL